MCRRVYIVHFDHPPPTFEIHFFSLYKDAAGGMGMGMANQLELISVYACCSTRVEGPFPLILHNI